MTTRERVLRRMNLLPHPRHRATRRERCPQNHSQSQDTEGSQSPIGSPMLFHINPQIPPLTVGSAEVSFRSFNPSHHPLYPRSHRPRIQYRARHPKQCCTPRASCQEIQRDQESTGSSGNDSCVQSSSYQCVLQKRVFNPNKSHTSSTPAHSNPFLSTTHTQTRSCQTQKTNPKGCPYSPFSAQ